MGCVVVLFLRLLVGYLEAPNLILEPRHMVMGSYLGEHLFPTKHSSFDSTTFYKIMLSWRLLIKGTSTEQNKNWGQTKIQNTSN